MDNIPLVPASIDNAVHSVSHAVTAMMDEAKQADTAQDAEHASASSSDAGTVQRAAATSDSSPTRRSNEEVKDTEDGRFKQTSCHVCGSHRSTSSNQILLCDGCDRECHMKCSTPPLSRVPKGNWYCQYCAESKADTTAYVTEEKEQSGKEEPEAERDTDEDEFVPTKKRVMSKASGTDSKRKKSVKKVKDEAPQQRSHVFDRYQFGGTVQCGKEEKEEQDDAAIEEKGGGRGGGYGWRQCDGGYYATESKRKSARRRVQKDAGPSHRLHQTHPHPLALVALLPPPLPPPPPHPLPHPSPKAVAQQALTLPASSYPFGSSCTVRQKSVGYTSTLSTTSSMHRTHTSHSSLVVPSRMCWLPTQQWAVWGTGMAV